MKTILVLSLFLTLPLSAFSQDIKCTGVGPGYLSESMTYEVTSNKEHAFMIKEYVDENNGSTVTFGSVSSWKEGGAQAVGMTNGMIVLYRLDAHHATLKNIDSAASDKAGEKVYRYISMTCE